MAAFLSNPTSGLRLSKGGVVAIAALFAAGLFLAATRTGGLGVTPDSLSYIAASKTLLAGDGYQRYTSLPFYSWPPLYPTILAGVNLIGRLFGLDTIEGIRYAHLLVFTGVILLTGQLCLRFIRSTPLIAAALLVTTLWYGLFAVSINVLSEPIFLFISLVFFLYLPRFLEQGKLHQFILLFFLAADGVLQRYAGIGLIPAAVVCIFLFMQGRGWRSRALYALTFSLSAIPYLAWYFRGRSLTVGTVRDRVDPLAALTLNLKLTPPRLAEWFLPPFLRGPVGDLLAAALVVAVLCGVIWVYFRASRAGQTPSIRSYPILIATYVAVYMGVYYTANTLIYTTDIDQRHLSVMFPFVIVLVVYSIDQMVMRYRARVPGLYAGAIGLVALWVAYQAVLAYTWAPALAKGCCDAISHRQMEIVQWLNEHPPEGRVYSNTPITLLYTNLRVQYGPSLPGELADWSLKAFNGADTVYIVAFSNVETLTVQAKEDFYYPFSITDDELATVARIERIAELPEGVIYRLSREDRPGE